jgi:hypothetical protein
MVRLFSSLKTGHASSKTYRTRDEARADMFDYIERFYNAKGRHSTIGYLSPMDFEAESRIRLAACHPNRVQAKPPTPSEGQVKRMGIRQHDSR